MKIYVADPCGFCYGVKRAIHVAELQTKGYNNSIATLGELVHNPRVVEKLRQQGVECKEKLAESSMPLVLMCGKHRKRLLNWQGKAVS